MSNSTDHSNTIVWLHLSDLHLCEPKTGWDSYKVLKTLRKDLVHMQDQYGLRPDLMFFTGDAAYGQIGTRPGESLTDQFKDVERFLSGVRTAFRPEVEKANVFLVPGNHDIDRGRTGKDQTYWLDQQTQLDEITEMIRTGNVQWQRYMDRLTAYVGFLRDNGYNHLLDDPQRLIYAVVREVSGLRVGIGGLNSAWSCCRDKEKGKLWFGGAWQLGHLRSQLEEKDFSIALIHHPINWFVEYEDPHLWREIERDFEFCLHGHEHDRWVTTVDTHTRIAADACYERSESRNGYNFVRLNLESGTGEVWLRRYDPAGGGWIPGVIHGQTNNEGKYALKSLRFLSQKATRGQWNLTLSMDIADVTSDQAEQIVEKLREISGYRHMKLVAVEPGSVDLILLSTAAAFERVERLASTGDLNERLGIRVEGVRWLGSDAMPQPAQVRGGAEQATPARRDGIYISYSHRDRQWLERLHKVLIPRCHQQRILSGTTPSLALAMTGDRRWTPRRPEPKSPYSW